MPDRPRPTHARPAKTKQVLSTKPNATLPDDPRRYPGRPNPTVVPDAPTPPSSRTRKARSGISRCTPKSTTPPHRHPGRAKRDPGSRDASPNQPAAKMAHVALSQTAIAGAFISQSGRQSGRPAASGRRQRQASSAASPRSHPVRAISSPSSGTRPREWPWPARRASL